ncbi:MAG: hypothetical protein UIB61_06400 [Treponema sp.]|nr:hypothetical protein [Treponema sp.]
MKINILKKGDSVLNVDKNFIAVRRKNGEVDIVPLIEDETGLRVNVSKIVTIGYGDNIVTANVGDVTVINYQ